MSMLSALAFLIAPGCGDDRAAQSSSTTTSSSSSSTSGSSSSAAGSGGAGGQDTSFRVSGTVSYEYVPCDLILEALAYGATEKRPIRGVSVRLLDADTNLEIAKTTSDEKGNYSFEYMSTPRVKVWVYAETEEPVITVEDNTAGDEVYVLSSNDVDSAADVKLDVLATTGWGGTSYAGARASAPFAVLDTAYTASQRFLNEASPPPQIPALKVNWSVDNRPEQGDKAQGQINTSHWDKEELYILGKEDVDTDEFDSHIIVHEWGHSFQTRLSRSDSIGGTHSAGDVIDPRLAFGEGFANALSAMILDPNTVYTDISGLGQAEGFSKDYEENDDPPEVTPGWFSERSVASILFDLYDAPNEPFDNVSVGINGVYGALVTLKTTPSFTTLFSFVAVIKAENPQAAADIDGLVTYHTLDADFGVDAIEDEWATGETHTGGVASSLPLYTEAPIGGMYTAGLTGGNPDNWLAQNRYFKIMGDGLPVTVQSTSVNDVDLKVYHVGEVIATAATVGGDEVLTFDTVSGEIYLLTVSGFNQVVESYFADISVMH
jgi:hypothetical protein